ncbi:MAG: isomerizing glutamine--fructose-6-phosphate transaminase, partial [Rhodospirillales bacterium]
MCGIIGIVGKKQVTPMLLKGLKQLEYRGYDSAGVATLVDGQIRRLRAEGKLINLRKRLEAKPLSGTTGIGHTRWATHGIPNERNAHPHATDRVAVVHNGIIENFQELRHELEGEGRQLASDTDTEVVAHLITKYLDQGFSPQEATSTALKRLDGAFALAIIFAGRPDLLIGARRGSPLAIGYGKGEMYLGSDALALAPLTQRISYLEDGDWVVIDGTGTYVFDAGDQPMEREVRLTALSGAAAGKGEYRHFMLKEIYEQPQVIGDTLHAFVNPAKLSITLPDLPFSLDDISKVTLIACGTSFYAATVAKY